MPVVNFATLVLVETSVWISVARKHPPAITELTELRRKRQVAVCGTVIQEFLQGCRDDQQFEESKARFKDFTYLAEKQSDFIRGAAIYRRLRAEGMTIPANDCRIAAVALRLNIELHAEDFHFRHVPGLRMYAG